MVTTIKIGARSAVTTRPIPGVTYQGAADPSASLGGLRRTQRGARRGGGVVALKPRGGMWVGAQPPAGARASEDSEYAERI